MSFLPAAELVDFVDAVGAIFAAVGRALVHFALVPRVTYRKSNIARWVGWSVGRSVSQSAAH